MSLFSSVPENHKVLHFCDDTGSRECLQRFLGGQGFDVISVGNRQEFFDVINVAPYEVAIVDIGLSNEEELALVRYLRTHTATRVIVLSGSSSSQDCMEGYLSGADNYLGKPVDFSVLSAVLNSLLSRCAQSQRFHDGCSGSSSSSWILCKANRELIAPDNKRIPLTTKEYMFLSCLAAGADVVKRADLLEILGYEQNEYGHKRLETLVYRIRRKARTVEFFPLITHHGYGYSFSMDLILRKTC
ncbi:response regulator transcription factor [Prosthecochloris sp. N3]|uniref:Response regulator transcription factor n=1 Tax=Prosthecochloris ethylica TaxID=2743976 RepID=A0ABR9XR76_9CHLB|nr:response regulator transcription factor [Prosthecochloris ethylica]MBF0636526.1 response regulator transcription factor [Prosthecochloris ethylica]NUK47158.1 response regulator transcription factor [Prosthecochloris ethylica]